MALNASGPISLGGSTSGQSINLELGLSATAAISLNDAGVRTLLGVSSGAITLNNAYGKSAVAVDPNAVGYLVIAGGGGGGGLDVGGDTGNAGGGAGGYRTNVGSSGGGASAEASLTLSNGVAYTVTVGAGGAIGTSGNQSVFLSRSTVGGGRGGSRAIGYAAEAGGSGGGGSSQLAVLAGAAGTASEGYAGGAGDIGSRYYTGGGGGGAGSVGTAASSSSGAAGNGGSGVSSGIDSVTRGGGGAGKGGVSDGTASGGGGATLTNGSANTGGGGGAGTGFSLDAGLGGSGIVIIRISDTRTATFSSGVTSSGGSPSGGYKIYYVTATSTTSETVTFS